MLVPGFVKENLQSESNVNCLMLACLVLSCLVLPSRFVAVSALTNYYKTSISPGSSILDIASSWVSHYPLNFPETTKKISGSGMNRFEMQANDQVRRKEFYDYD